MKRLRISCVLAFFAGACAAALAQSAENIHICPTTSRPDCREGVAFFDKFRSAVASDERDIVVSMVHFPLRVQLEGRSALIKNKSQLLRDYDKVFTAAVRCAITGAKRTEVWANWQGYTVVSGVVWWDARAARKLFGIITVNNGGFYEGCSDQKTGNTVGAKRKAKRCTPPRMHALAS